MSSQGSNAAKNGADFENLVYAVMHYKIKKNYQVKSEIKDNTNVSHLSYIGDSELGSHVNIGAGTITATLSGNSSSSSNMSMIVSLGSTASTSTP